MDEGPEEDELVGEDEDALRAFLGLEWLMSGEDWRLEDMLCCCSISVSLGSSETMTGCLDTTILGFGGPLIEKARANFLFIMLFVYYESIKRGLQRRLIYWYR
jgi:hypothetical protein